VSEAVGGDNDGDKGKDKMKFINIVEELDLPVPRAVAYKAWTQFEEFPSFMKKVENVEQQEDQTVEWKAQIFWSHRTWTAEIVDQVPNQRIVWRSKGEKGHVDGAVTFHELTPDLTRMLVNLEYYPKGFFERTGNLWRAQGRRARLELKFFRRYITSEVLLRQDEVEGWPGEIHDGEVSEEASDSKDQDSERQEASDSKDQDSERQSASAPAKRPAKKPAPTATTSSRPRPAAKKSTSSESSPSRPRPAAKKSSSNESSPSRPRPAAKKSSSSASSSRGTTAKKSTTSSSRSRS
jgi:Polyketide cyclase / dehydrase and lipid transport